MPNLILRASDNGTLDSAALEIASVMVSPNCESTRIDYKLLRLAEVWKRMPNPDVAAYPRLAEIAQTGATLKGFHQEFYKKHGRGGPIAGAILLAALGALPEHRSLTFAKRAVAQNYGNKAGVGSLHKYWNEFASVAHLYAAYIIIHDPSFLGQSEPLPGFPCHPSRLSLFILLAEHFRQLGESTQPCRAVKPLLQPALTWKLQPQFIVYVREAFEIHFNPDCAFMAGAMPEKRRYQKTSKTRNLQQ